MSTFHDVLSDVFDRGAERRIPSSADEAATIARAQAGDEAAKLSLIYAYAAPLRAAVSLYSRRDDAHGALSVEDARQEAVLALLGLIETHDPARSDRLAIRVSDTVRQALSEAAGATMPVPIPARVLRRFYGVLKRADGDLAAAANLAPSYDLSRETFHAIADALRSWESLDGNPEDGDGVTAFPTSRPLWGEEDAFADAEDRILCEVAFSAVGDLEEDVARAAYGFSSYTPKSDAEIAGDLGLSRPTIQRTRTGALRKMRARLAVDVDE